MPQVTNFQIQMNQKRKKLPKLVELFLIESNKSKAKPKTNAIFTPLNKGDNQVKYLDLFIRIPLDYTCIDTGMSIHIKQLFFINNNSKTIS